MARRRFALWNGAVAALTATTNMTPIAVGTTGPKTMLQIKPTTNIAVIEWGYSLQTVPTAVVEVGLITSGTTAATVTAYNAGDIVKYDDAGSTASSISLGTSASGFTSSAEGSFTGLRLMDFQEQWGQSFGKQFPLDREPGVQANDVLRIRAYSATAINMICYVVWEE